MSAYTGDGGPGIPGSRVSPERANETPPVADDEDAVYDPNEEDPVAMPNTGLPMGGIGAVAEGYDYGIVHSALDFVQRTIQSGLPAGDYKKAKKAIRQARRFIMFKTGESEDAQSAEKAMGHLSRLEIQLDDVHKQQSPKRKEKAWERLVKMSTNPSKKSQWEEDQPGIYDSKQHIKRMIREAREAWRGDPSRFRDLRRLQRIEKWL